MSNAITVALLGLAVLAATTIAWFRLAGVLAAENRFFFLILWTLALVLGVGGLFAPGADFISAGIGATVGLGALGMLGVYNLGRQRARGSVGVEDVIPQFTALDDAGVTFDSASLAGKPALLKFFRGHW